MKKVIVAAFFGSVVAMSCSSNKTSTFIGTDPFKLKGDWQITDVNYDKSYKIMPFDEGMDINCFVGSQWRLIPNNGKGSYAAGGSGSCPQVSRNFMFSVTKDQQFSFKIIPDGAKARKVDAGYFLTLDNKTPQSFDLVQNVSDGTTPLTVVYHFEKIN